MRYIILLFIFCYSNTMTSYACRFTVREIGFSDIGSSDYMLYVFTNSQTSHDDNASIKKLSYAMLHDSNIQLEVIDVDKNKSTESEKFLALHSIKSFPTAVFVSPKGHSENFSLHSTNKSLDESLWLLLENLVSSPLRESMKEELLKAYCVVLVIEGSNQKKNEHVLQEARDAVSRITMTLDQMPKIVNTPPTIMVLSRDKIEEEKILLMSLDIADKVDDETAISIIYGRGRIMGPVLLHDQISRDQIFNLLSIVGADCECGLDNSWILGKMIPLRWDLTHQGILVDFLGFDVENPLLKSEMSKIMSMKPNLESPFDPLAHNLSEITDNGKPEIHEEPKTNVKKTDQIARGASNYGESKGDDMDFKTFLIYLGGIVSAILIIGGVLFFRNTYND